MIDNVLAAENAVHLAGEHYRNGNYLDAENLCQEVLAYRPNHPAALHQLGIARFHLGRDDAEALVRRAVALEPFPFLYYTNLGMMLEAKGQPDKALTCFDQALAIAPNHAEARASRGLNLLKRGKLMEGFRDFDWRWNNGRFSSGNQLFSQPRWRGESLAGRTLLLSYEQGFGDTIQFARYVPLIQEREPDATLIVGCQMELNALLQRYLPELRIISPGEVLPAFDLHCPLMSLPLVYGTDSVETIRVSRAAISSPTPKKVRRWQARLQQDASRLKVGLAWSGSLTFTNNAARSLALPAMASLGRAEGVSFYSLQKGDPARQARDNPPFPIQDCSGELQDFDDTAALMSALDLVITVDTSVAHLAGALGRPTWVLLSTVCDWRWFTGREDSPWYPTMRLFRQRALGQWAEVIERVVETLKDFRAV